jgi:hypothetical protein
MKPTYRILAGGVFALVSIGAKAQPTAGNATPGHPIPSAPKKSFAPASIQALPGLQCKLYPTGSDASAGLVVFTDDDGYARFHPVRVAPRAAVQPLTMDCPDSHGSFSSYLAHLTAAQPSKRARHRCACTLR